MSRAISLTLLNNLWAYARSVCTQFLHQCVNLRVVEVRGVLRFISVIRVMIDIKVIRGRTWCGKDSDVFEFLAL